VADGAPALAGFTVPVTVQRFTAGAYVDGRYAAGEATEIDIFASVQQVSDDERLRQLGADETREAIKLYTTAELLTSNEATGQRADVVSCSVWGDQLYEVAKVQRFKMGTLDHVRAYCVRRDQNAPAL
jgi:hypothetical protein